MNIYYIHGFNSYKGSSTPKKLRRVLERDVHELFYRSEQPFETIMDDLRRQYFEHNGDTPSIIAGTSMGGFFADQLADMPGIQALVLINPVVDPVEVLSKPTFLGTQTNFITHETYTFSLETAATYATRRDMRKFPVKRFLLLAEHDELLDSSIARQWWKDTAIPSTLKGGHRLTDFSAISTLMAGILPELDDINERYAG